MQDRSSHGQACYGVEDTNPVLLLDKSVLRGLSNAEMAAVHAVFTVLVPPILLTEIVGCLERKPKKDSDRGQAGLLATRLVSGFVIPPNWRTLMYNELRGQTIPMDGTVPVDVSGIDAANARGVLLRLAQSRPGSTLQAASRLWSEVKELRSPAGLEAREGHDNWADAFAEADERLENASSIAREIIVAANLSAAEADSIDISLIHADKAPYSKFCLRLWLAQKMVSQRLGKRTLGEIADTDYLFYLPFCSFFSTHDRLQREKSSALLAGYQHQVSLLELKKGLGKISEFAGLIPDWAQNIDRIRQIGEELFAFDWINLAYRDKFCIV